MTDKPRRKLGRPRTVPPWKISYIRRAVKLRRQLTNKALVKKLGMAWSTVETYAHWKCKGMKL